MTVGPKTGAGMRMCSLLTRDRGEDPVGHAFPYDRIIIIELPKPWPRRASSAPGASQALQDLADHFRTLRMRTYQEDGEAGVKARGFNVVLNHVAPDPEYSLPGHRRVFQMRRPQGPFSAYCKEEYQVPEADVAGLVEALLYKKSTHRWQGVLVKSAMCVRDLLVCTHGSVDTCCATFGYPLYRKLRRLANRSAGKLRVWQATHFQQHRFAPVVLDLPEARVWGAVGADHAEALALRNRHPSTLRSCYIGWAGVEQAYIQAVEREALAQEGWDWVTYCKSGRITKMNEAEERAEVQIDFASVDQDIVGSYLATVEIVEHIPGLVGCFSPGQTRDAPQYRISGLKRSVRSGRVGTQSTKQSNAPKAVIPAAEQLRDALTRPAP